MRREAFFFSLVAGLSLVAASCISPADRRDATPEGPLPADYLEGTGSAPLPERWWTAFGSEELNALVESALAGNLSLRQAWARLEQARALARQAGAESYPAVSAEAGAAHARARSNAGRTHGEVYSLGLVASYEVDLWRRVRSQRGAAVLEARASRQDLESAAMMLAASVTGVWLDILANRAERGVLEQQLGSSRTYLELLEGRFRKSLVSALDVDQQQQVVAQLEAQVPLVEANEQVLLYELAVLLGRLPGGAPDIRQSALPESPALPAAGLPADLLGQRPDIRAALARLHAADRRVVVARADRLPALRLSGGGRYEDDSVSDIFRNWYVNLAAGLAAPLVDGGRLRAEVERTRAVVDERLAAYREAVLNGVLEVEGALVRERKQREHIAGLTKEIRFARRALVAARERYTKGENDYLRVLTTLLSLHGRERDLIRAQRRLLAYRVDLYRALGGGWTRQLSLAPEAAETKEHP